MNYEACLDNIEKLGFAIVPSVVSRSELAELRTQIDNAIDTDWMDYKHLPGKHRFIALDLVTRGRPFVRLLENEVMHRIFSHFLGDTCILYSFTSTIAYPNEQQYTANVHVDMHRLIPGYHLGLLMTLAIDDFTPENGATYYLPGSHHSVEKPDDERFYQKAVRVTRSAGDAAFFHPRVWHAGGPNLTNEPRRGCTVFACRSWMKQRFDYPRMVTPDILAQLGETGRRFLGFNVRVPTSLREFYVPPEERLYKANQG
jgi:ectoine hydroxylase-related dioxygenase (phytanoyl-CoA dioxygenase family)